MKKLLLFIALVAIISSCSEDPIKVEHPEKVTTLEITELAKKDTNWYKLVIIDNDVFAVNENNKVAYIISNDTAYTNTINLIIFVVLVSGFMLLILFKTDS